eukprot:6174485-Pleurochrysis_carterae.AAC.1
MTQGQAQCGHAHTLERPVHRKEAALEFVARAVRTPTYDRPYFFRSLITTRHLTSSEGPTGQQQEAIICEKVHSRPFLNGCTCTRTHPRAHVRVRVCVCACASVRVRVCVYARLCAVTCVCLRSLTCVSQSVRVRAAVGARVAGPTEQQVRFARWSSNCKQMCVVRDTMEVNALHRARQRSLQPSSAAVRARAPRSTAL